MIIMNPGDPAGRIEVQDIPPISAATCGIDTAIRELEEDLAHAR